MILINMKNSHKIIFSIMLFTTILFGSKANTQTNEGNVILTVKEIKKRNRAGCQRLGNIYGYCEWIVILRVDNKRNTPLNYFCSNLKLNKKNYEICFGKNKKSVFLESKDYKHVILNLNVLTNYKNNNNKPKVKFSKISIY